MLFIDDMLCMMKDRSYGDMSSTNLHWASVGLPSMSMARDEVYGISCIPQHFFHLFGYAAHTGVD